MQGPFESLAQQNRGERLARLRRRLRDEGLSAVLISNPVDVHYLTGYSGEAAYLWLDTDRLVMLSDGRFAETIASEIPEAEIKLRQSPRTIDHLASELVGDCNGPCGLQYAGLTHAAFITIAHHAAATHDVSGWIAEMRMIKSESEVAAIVAATELAEEALIRVWRNFRRQPAVTEKRLAESIEMTMRCELGASGVSFPPIVAGDAHASLPHARPRNVSLVDARLVLIDWGCVLDNYCSDTTRTYIASDVDRRLGEAWKIVADAQSAAIQTIRPGVTAHQVDAAARSVIESAGYGEQFVHSTGHSFGLEVHESPLLGVNRETVLATGMVLTVEPGIYLPGLGGIRIEDMVLVTKDGCRVLSKLPHNLHDIA